MASQIKSIRLGMYLAIVLHKICRQEDAIPLGWHRNAHENTLGTLFIFKLA